MYSSAHIMLTCPVDCSISYPSWWCCFITFLRCNLLYWWAEMDYTIHSVQRKAKAHSGKFTLLLLPAPKFVFSCLPSSEQVPIKTQNNWIVPVIMRLYLTSHLLSYEWSLTVPERPYFTHQHKQKCQTQAQEPLSCHLRIRLLLFRVGSLKGNSSDCMLRQLFSSSGAGAHCWGLLDSPRGAQSIRRSDTLVIKLTFLTTSCYWFPPEIWRALISAYEWKPWFTGTN